jgi:hypothetical protein
MGVVDTSPLRPVKGRTDKSESLPQSPRVGTGSGARRAATPYGRTRL